jgi:hypothetical protein
MGKLLGRFKLDAAGDTEGMLSPKVLVKLNQFCELQWREADIANIVTLGDFDMLQPGGKGCKVYFAVRAVEFVAEALASFVWRFPFKW